ncbi:MAG: ATP synthase subunit I [Thiocapsa sp.]|nr:ATP synthase subunit I [Thiocapsa sp.]MCG6898107.1 ATP synthase subunit I [Thiocapsa sp.]MCG6985267.1 ATP synthase subunit I [Thiocapsa sp.]
MNDWLQLTASLIAGVLLGLVYFWSLWTTVGRLMRQDRPAIWMLGGMLLRFGLILVVFYPLARYGDWRHVLSAAVGFTLSRILTVQLVARRRIHKGSDA